MTRCWSLVIRIHIPRASYYRPEQEQNHGSWVSVCPGRGFLSGRAEASAGFVRAAHSIWRQIPCRMATSFSVTPARPSMRRIFRSVLWGFTGSRKPIVSKLFSRCAISRSTADWGAGGGPVGGSGSSAMASEPRRMAIAWVRLRTGNSGTVGIRTTMSHRSTSSRRIPRVSFPKTSAVSWRGRLERAAAASDGVRTGRFVRPRPEAVATSTLYFPAADGKSSWIRVATW